MFKKNIQKKIKIKLIEKNITQRELEKYQFKKTKMKQLSIFDLEVEE